MNELWSYALAAVGLTGLYLTGNMKRVGFLVGLGAQVLWIAYAIATRQWGFIATAVVYGGMYYRNWIRWKKTEEEVESV